MISKYKPCIIETQVTDCITSYVQIMHSRKTRASFLIKKDLRNVVMCINFEMYCKIHIFSEQSKRPYVPFCTQATTLEKYKNQKHTIFL